MVQSGKVMPGQSIGRLEASQGLSQILQRLSHSGKEPPEGGGAEPKNPNQCSFNFSQKIVDKSCQTLE